MHKKHKTVYLDWIPVKVTYHTPTPVTKKPLGDGLSYADPTETRSPTSTVGVPPPDKWTNPTNAYASDDTYATASVPVAGEGKTQEYDDYGFSIDSGDVIDEVLVRVECYEVIDYSDVLSIATNADYYARSYNVPVTGSEQIIDIDVTDTVNTPAKVNALHVRITLANVSGGCFHPETRFVTYDGKTFGLKLVSEMSTETSLLGIDRKTLRFHPTKCTHFEAHKGKWRMVRAYVMYPKSYIISTCQSPKLKELFGIRGNEKEIVSDSCWTDDHKLYTRNKGYILAGELKIDDVLGELFYDCGKLRCAGLPILHIENFDFEGVVYDVRCKDSWLFSKFLLGHMSKDTPE